MVALAVVAEPFIVVLLTAKWLPSVVYMQWICLGFASIPLVSSCLVAIKAMGRSDVYMRLELVRRIDRLRMKARNQARSDYHPRW
jgi:O-antigen/teichoic acid export membrane protein